MAFKIICEKCGHINNHIRVMDIEKAKNDIVYFAEKVLDVNLLEWQKDLLLKYQQHRKL